MTYSNVFVFTLGYLKYTFFNLVSKLISNYWSIYFKGHGHRFQAPMRTKNGRINSLKASY